MKSAVRNLGVLALGYLLQRDGLLPVSSRVAGGPATQHDKQTGWPRSNRYHSASWHKPEPQRRYFFPRFPDRPARITLVKISQQVGLDCMSLQARAWATSALSHLPCRPAPTSIDGGPRETVADLGGADYATPSLNRSATPLVLQSQALSQTIQQVDARDPGAVSTSSLRRTQSPCPNVPISVLQPPTHTMFH